MQPVKLSSISNASTTSAADSKTVTKKNPVIKAAATQLSDGTTANSVTLAAVVSVISHRADVVDHNRSNHEGSTQQHSTLPTTTDPTITNTTTNPSSTLSDRRVQIRRDEMPGDTTISERFNEAVVVTSNKRTAETVETSNRFHKRQRINIEHDDLDVDDWNDPLMASEYVEDIFDYLHTLESKALPDSEYLTWQPNLQPRMRSILVDWIIEIHLRFRLNPETLFLSINLMDRFLSIEQVDLQKLQLLAVSSLFIASKYEEVHSLSVRSCSAVTDGGCSEEEIIVAEKEIIRVLEFNVAYANPMNFLRRISKADDYDIENRTMGKYLLEITIADHRFIGMLPSLCSAAAMNLARKISNSGDWNNNLIYYSGGYTESDLEEVCNMIIEYLISPIVHTEFFRKYASRRFLRVSIIARRWAKSLVRENLE